MEVKHSCRCCLRCPPDKALTTPYSYLGKTELYADMLLQCFDIHLVLGDDVWSGICSACVGRLRDASDFKLQVQRCQEELQEWLQGAGLVKVEEPTVELDMQDGDGTNDPLETNEEPHVKPEMLDEELTPDKTLQEMPKSEMKDGDSMSEDNEPMSHTRHSRRCDSAPAETTSAPSSAEHETETRLKLNTDTLPHAAEADVYICDMCGALFKRKHHLVRHIKVHPHYLQIQSKTLLNDNKLGVHRSHASRTPHCDIDNKKFKQLSYLKIHRQIRTGEKPHSCNICKKRFTQLGNLKEHIRIHTGERSFGCDICKKRYTRLDKFKQHANIHTDQKPFGCEICNKRFRQLSHLKEHTLIHTNEKPFGCEICNKRFRHLYTLKHHILIHTDERPFGCEICKKCFRQLGHLKRHTRTHKDERPFGCEICKKKFKQLSTLKNHKRIHTDERTFGCEISQLLLTTG